MSLYTGHSLCCVAWAMSKSGLQQGYSIKVSSSVVRPSICLSISLTSRSSTKTAKPRITQTMPYDRPGSLVFWCQKPLRNSKASLTTGPPNRDGMGQKLQFSTNISLCFRNSARKGHSYYGRLIGTSMHEAVYYVFFWWLMHSEVCVMSLVPHAGRRNKTWQLLKVLIWLTGNLFALFVEQ